MVDGGGLENRSTGNGTGGSNPSLSAIPAVARPESMAYGWTVGIGQMQGQMQQTVATGWRLTPHALAVVRDLPCG